MPLPSRTPLIALSLFHRHDARRGTIALAVAHACRVTRHRKSHRHRPPRRRRRRLDPDSSRLRFDEPPCDRQTEADAAAAGVGGSAPRNAKEFFEHTLPEIGRNAGTLVGDAQLDVLLVDLRRTNRGDKACLLAESLRYHARRIKRDCGGACQPRTRRGSGEAVAVLPIVFSSDVVIWSV